jgi:protein SCO1/2
MPSGRRWILPVTMSVLVVAALVFAIVATKESKSGSSSATTATSAQAPLTRGGFVGAELPQARPAPPIALSDQYGRPVSLAALRGRPVLVGFVSTSCGAPCELVAQQIRGALDELHEPIPVLLISAGPAADTPAAVRDFLAKVSLSGRVYYLTGPPAALAGARRAYRVRPAAGGAGPTAQGATVLLIDSAGRERVAYGSEQLTPEALSHDIERLSGSPPTP